MMIREYLKLSRSFNAVLTGVSPVMGAIAMEQYNIVTLFLLFLVGFLGHTFGFVFNDIIDYKIDKSSEEISDRPLISGTISIKKAWIFAIASMIVAFIIALYIAIINQNFFPVLILAVSAFFIALYDLISKKYPFMDVFVSFGVFFLILYGAFYGKTSVKSIYDISKLAWTVCVLGSIQVLFMQTVAGGMKDIENDFMKGAKTSAIKMGVRITDGTLKVSLRFKAFAYIVQMADMIIVFLPFFIVWEINNPSVLQYFQWVLLGIIGVMMFTLSHRLLSMKHFERSKARKFIGSHYVTNFALVPIMLMTLNPWAGLLVFFPALGFILSNVILHGTILQPKTM
jgi:4-hydroxybenzoate polyprenyltransferase